MLYKTNKNIRISTVVLLLLAITLANCSSPVETIIDQTAVDSLGVVIGSLETTVDSLEITVDSLGVTVDSLETTVDSLQVDIDSFQADTVITIAEISISPVVSGRWGDDFLVAYMAGFGINRSDAVIEDVSMEFTLSAFPYTKGILSETIGYFTLDTVIPQYMPNSPFPYEIQHDLVPSIGYQLYVSADTIFSVSRVHWAFRVVVGNGLTKRVEEWQYGGVFKRND